MDAIACQSCRAELLPAKTSSQQLVRCGQCGNTFLPDLINEEAIQKTDRMAKWSMWLGIASMVLCMFTGVPAFILGIRSLRRMKFRVAKQREKVQAIVGTTLGLVFGVFGGTCLTLAGVMAGILYASFEMTDDPDRIAKMAEDVVEFEDTIGFFPYKGANILQQKFIEYSDHEDRTKSDNRLFFLQFHMQPNNVQLKSHMEDRFIGKISDYTQVDRSELDWEMVEGTFIVREIFEHKANPDDRVIRYISTTKVRTSWLGACLLSRRNESSPPESKIRALFESIHPKILDGH